MVQINTDFSDKENKGGDAGLHPLLLKAKITVGKFLPTIILAIALIFVTSSLFLALKNHSLSQQLKDRGSSLQTERKENNNLLSKLQGAQKELAKVKKELEAANGDRDRLNVQAKNLLSERDKAKEVESAFEKLKLDKEVVEKDRELFIKENQGLAKQAEALKGERDELETVKQQLIKEKEQLQQSLDQAREKSGINKAEGEKLLVKKENTELANNLKAAESQLKASKSNEEKLREELKRLTDKADKLSEAYTQAVKTNKAYEGGVLEGPAKVTEIARQNKVLIRQTARMHYNLGVFYSKQKEYSRAVSEFKKTIELTPDDAYTYFNLGYIYAENLVNRDKAMEYFRQYLQYARKDDKDADWVKKYILTWETWQGKKPVE